MREKDQQRIWNDPNACRQQVRMISVQVEGLRPDELATALAYELEPVSGIPVAEAEVVWKPLPNEDPSFRLFDVALVRRRRRGGARGSDLRVLCICCILAGLAMVLVAVDAVTLKTRQTSLAREVAARQPLQDSIDLIRRKTASVRSETESIRRRRETEAKAQSDCAKLREAFVGMMDGVSGGCGGKAVVKSFVSEGPFDVRIRAVATDAQTAADVMVAMTRALDACGWDLTPGPVEAFAGGAGVAFEVVLKFRNAW